MTQGTGPRMQAKLDRLRRRLEAERERYRSIVRGMSGAGLDASMTESTGELSSYDQHTADSGNEMFEREKDLGTRADAQVTLDRIDAAFGRLEAGTFGMCVSCGRPIGEDRLEAIPYAEECVACSGRHGETEYQRPIEEKALGFAESFTDSEEEVAYDAEDAWQDVAKYGTANSPQDVIGAVEHDEAFINADENVGAVTELDSITNDLEESEEEEREQERERRL